MVTRVTRQCTKCKKTKPRTKEFWSSNPRSFDNLDYSCKDCHSQQYQNWKINNPDKVKLRREKDRIKHHEKRHIINEQQRRKYADDEEYRKVRNGYKKN